MCGIASLIGYGVLTFLGCGLVIFLFGCAVHAVLGLSLESGGAASRTVVLGHDTEIQKLREEVIALQFRTGNLNAQIINLRDGKNAAKKRN